jgi:hypothetical protein
LDNEKTLKKFETVIRDACLYVAEQIIGPGIYFNRAPKGMPTYTGAMTDMAGDYLKINGELSQKVTEIIDKLVRYAGVKNSKQTLSGTTLDVVDASEFSDDLLEVAMEYYRNDIKNLATRIPLKILE